MGDERPARRTRLEVTKRAIHDFIERRPEDRIGLVVFSDNSYVVSPLTLTTTICDATSPRSTNGRCEAKG